MAELQYRSSITYTELEYRSSITYTELQYRSSITYILQKTCTKNLQGALTLFNIL